MGRKRTGITTKEVLRIELSKLLVCNFIQKGSICRSTFEWTDGSAIGIESYQTEKEQYIRLFYTFTPYNGEKKDFDYKIQLTFVPSNLGNGEVPYFVCPVSGKRCRILYKAYGSPIWKSREAYHKRIYYPSQTSSKLSKMNDRYWRLDKRIKSIYEDIRYQTHYNGKPTRRYKRYLKLLEEQEKAEFLRWTPKYMPKVLRKQLRGKELR